MYGTLLLPKEISSLLFFFKCVSFLLFVFSLLEETWVKEILAFPVISTIEKNYSSRMKINGGCHTVPERH